MQSSSSTHTYTKRSVDLDPPLIAGIVVVVVAFNFILGISWCVVRDRKKLKTLHKRRISGPVDCEKYEQSVAFAVSTGAVPKAVPIKGNGQARGSYYELIHALQQHPGTPAPVSPTRKSRGSSRRSTEGARLAKFVLRPQDIKDLDGVPIYLKTKVDGHRHAVQLSGGLGVPARADLKRANSLAETASVYSSASAPLEFHEQLFRIPLDTPAPASAPAWMTELPKPPTPAMLSNVSNVGVEVPLPSPTLSLSSVTTNPPSPTTPISLPSTSTSSPSPPLTRTITQSTSLPTPPHIHWITPAAAFPIRSKRPNSVSSLSTILSLPESPRAPVAAPVTVAPLNIQRRSKGAQWGSVDLTRSTPLSSASATLHVQTPTTLVIPATPTVPARSPKRPVGLGSVEHLPV